VSTSIAVEAGRPDERPSTNTVERAASVFARAFAARLGADLAGFGTAGSSGLAGLGDSLPAGR
jgi:hypothetical protein